MIDKVLVTVWQKSFLPVIDQLLLPSCIMNSKIKIFLLDKFDNFISLRKRMFH